MVRNAKVTWASGSAIVLLALCAFIGCGEVKTARPPSSAPPTIGATATNTNSTTAKAPEPPPVATHEKPGDVGTVASPFKGKTWFTADGKAPDVKNKVCLVDFWQIT